MPERTANRAALRFVEDLTALRHQQNVTLDDIRTATRIPIDVLETFEGSVLQDNKLFNRVYLRSLVRAYAGAIGLDAERATDGLEDALDGRYDGELLREPEELADAEVLEAEPEAIPPDVPGEVGAPAEEASEEPFEAPRPEPPPPSAAPRTWDNAAATQAEHDQYDDPSAQPAPAPVPVGESWDAVSGSSRNPRVQPRGSDTPWGGIAAVVVVLALVGAGLFWWLGRDAAPTDEPDPTTTAAVATPQTEAAPAPANVTLPDTLTLRVTAKSDADSDGIQDMKIQVDDDLRRPYWMNKGESQDYRFVRRITVEKQLDDATLTLEGKPFSSTQVDSSGRIVIDRDAALRHLQGR